MLSRNNWKEQVRQQEPNKQRFTIKKLTIGVASVLIGFTFMGMSASADDQTTPTTSDPAVTPTKVQSNNTPSAQTAQSGQPVQGGAKGDAKTQTSTPAASPASYVRLNALYSDDSTDSNKYQVSYFPMNFNRPTTDTPVTKAQMPMLPYMMPDGTITGYNLIGDEHGAPFNPPKGLTASVDSKTGEVTVTVAKDVTTDYFEVIVDVEYQDGSSTAWHVPVHIKNYADQYIPAYKDTKVAANSSVNTGSPSFTKDSEAVTDVPSHTYAFKDGTTKMTINDKNSKNPVTVTIDKTSGAITFTAPDDATEYDIPVTVTYEDGSSNTATAKVFVNKSLDPTKVDPTNPEYKEMFKTVTRDIVTTSVSGQQTTEAQSLDFGRTMTIYGNGDPATYGKWEALSADQFASKDITPVDGYTSYYKIGNDGQKVYASAVPSASALDKDDNPVDGTTVYVGYDKSNADQYIPAYKDTTVAANSSVNTGSPSFTKDSEAVTDVPGHTYAFKDGTTKMTINDKNSKNPVTVTIDKTSGAITFTAPDDATEYDIPVTVTYEDGSSNTATAKVFVNKSLDPTKVDPTNPEYKEMFKTVTRDIVTTSVSGQQTTEAQSLDFGRTMTIYGNGDPATYGKWEALSADQFASKDITPVDGYTSYYKIGNDGQKVNAAAVPSTSALDKDGNPVDGTTVYVGYDRNNTTPGDDRNHNTNPGDNGNHNTNPGNNNGINNGTQNGNGSKTVNTNVTNNGNGDNSQNNKQALPQTGNTKNDAAVAGLGLAGLLAMLGLGGLKKKRN
jgi:LPXTG-motif cell wall-anchored protein